MLFFLPRKPILTELGKSVNILTIWGSKSINKASEEVARKGVIHFQV